MDRRAFGHSHLVLIRHLNHNHLDVGKTRWSGGNGANPQPPRSVEVGAAVGVH